MRLGVVIKRMSDATGKRAVHGRRPEYERRAVESLWPDVVGKHIASYTGRIYVKDRTLNVQIISASLKEELSYLRELLVRQLNEAAGADVISSIRFL